MKVEVRLTHIRALALDPPTWGKAYLPQTLAVDLAKYSIETNNTINTAVAQPSTSKMVKNLIKKR
jgi:hypothetical protein